MDDQTKPEPQVIDHLDARLGAIAFARHCEGRQFPLNAILLEMLSEHFSHRTERRGSGFTQATRWLADLINRPRTDQDWRYFISAAQSRDPHASVEGNPQTGFGLLQWRAILDSFVPIHAGQATLLDLFRALTEHPASKAPVLAPIAAEKLKIGTCPLAEQFFLEVACGRIRRGGRIHVVCDDAGTPVLLEKRGLGDEHSAISIAPVQIQQITLPAGTLIGLDYSDAILEHAHPCKNQRGFILSTRKIAAFRYLRLTTLAVSPKDRQLCFSSHFHQQVENALFLPDSATIQQLHQFANEQL